MILVCRSVRSLGVIARPFTGAPNEPYCEISVLTKKCLIHPAGCISWHSVNTTSHLCVAMFTKLKLCFIMVRLLACHWFYEEGLPVSFHMHIKSPCQPVVWRNTDNLTKWGPMLVHGIDWGNTLYKCNYVMLAANCCVLPANRVGVLLEPVFII